MSDSASQSFGDLLRRYRGAAGLTQETLAERARMSARAVSDLERGLRDRPRTETIRLLADALGLSADERARFGAVVRRARRSPGDTPERIVSSPRLAIASEDTLPPPHNLPAALTSFVGREQDIAAIVGLLPTTRLLTLIGVGGVGKTRLANRVAAEILDDFSDGVWLVELAPLTDPSLVPQAIANSLGIPERPNQPVLRVLTIFLHSRRCLLVLDNCEHLIDACAQVTASLLQVCPRLTVLATSRQALQVFGEVQWHVPSLPTPDPTSLANSPDVPIRPWSSYPAIQLFVERAQAVEPRLALTGQNLPAVVQICWQLDGLPLAIELAAARAHTLNVESIADRLGQRFQLLTTGSRVALPRQQTLRATIDWSYDLLAEPERVLFRRLAVFAGGFTLEAVEGICAGEGLAREAVLPMLLHLVDQSLVEREVGGQVGRYRLLETIRDYVRERLAAAEEVDVLRRQHGTWYLNWAKETETHIWGAEQKIWMDRFQLEHDNLRAALQFCREREVASGLHLAAYLHRFWVDRGYIVEGQRWLEDLLPRAPRDEFARASALLALGVIVLARGGTASAVAALEESLDLLRPNGPSRDLVHTLFWRGVTAGSEGDDALARSAIEECIDVARVTNDLDFAGLAMGILGLYACERGDLRGAADHFAESLALLKSVGALRAISSTLRYLSTLHRTKGDNRRAREVLRESLALAWGIGFGNGISGALINLGVLAQRTGDHPRAVRLIAAAARDSLPVLAPRLERNERDASMAASRAALGEEAFAETWAEGQALTLEQAVAYALEGEP